MRIGIVSDTHRNLSYLNKAVDFLISKHKIASLYHLGDDYDDVSELGDRYLDVVQVPGIYDERYRNGSLPSKQTETVMGLQILLVHSIDKDLTREDVAKSDIILHGHTHKAEIRLDDGKLYVNPGHLKGPFDKNMEPGFGMLSILDREVCVSIFDLDFKETDSMTLIRSESGLYRSS
ncbi:phosphoesterase [Chitinispirillum alkaliphilum]|nr:phosphoesterase [Chitinispirillum alkaliphilum]